MKPILFCILILVSLTACARSNSQDSHECNKDKGVCVYLKAEEPIIAGEPVTVTVTIKGEKDIPNLQIALSSTGNVYFEEPILKKWKKSDIGWKLNLKADKTEIAKYQVLFPPEEGFYHVVASVGTPDYGQIVTYSIRISILDKKGKVYYPGTKVSNSGDPIILPLYTVTPKPSSVPVETRTPSYP